ncbi:hypothetical protein KKG58_04955 [Patescibacteria group bacterium]|nr:hypothetical protein [Patescibacteria group bacterium]
MIGKKEWFKLRKYTGFGLSPKTWQGWVYVIVIILGIVFIQTQIYWSSLIRRFLFFVWIGLIVLDSIHIWVLLKKHNKKNI